MFDRSPNASDHVKGRSQMVLHQTAYKRYKQQNSVLSCYSSPTPLVHLTEGESTGLSASQKAADVHAAGS